MAVEFTKVVPLTDGQSLPFHRYEPDDELFRNRRLDAFEVATSSLNSRLIFDGMVAIEGCLGGIGVLICFAGTRACEFHRGLGQLFLDIRPAGAGLVASRNRYEPELSVTVFGVSDPEDRRASARFPGGWLSGVLSGQIVRDGLSPGMKKAPVLRPGLFCFLVPIRPRRGRAARNAARRRVRHIRSRFPYRCGT